jgi:hypothetical protein
MPKDPNQKALDDNDGRRQELVDRFGPDILIGLATDKPATPRRTFGQRVVQDRKKAQRLANQERQKEIMREALQVQNKADAYQRVVDNARNGHPSSPSDLAAAALYAVEQGIVERPSTIERLMSQAEQARRFEPMDAA